MADAIDPLDALQTIARLRSGRERMTTHAVAQIWMVWGLVVGLVGFASQAAFHARYAGGWVDPVTIVVGGGIGAIVTNAIWRAHALENDPLHRSWVPWALGVGGLMVLGVLVFLSNLVSVASTASSIMMAPLALMGAYGAGAIAWATRRHVRVAPGAVAAALLLVVFLLARFAPGPERTPAFDFLGNAGLSLINVLTFTLVGWLHFRTG